MGFRGNIRSKGTQPKMFHHQLFTISQSTFALQRQSKTSLSFRNCLVFPLSLTSALQKGKEASRTRLNQLQGAQGTRSNDEVAL